MDERVRILNHLVEFDQRQGRQHSITSLQARAQETKKYADNLRRFLLALNQD